MCRFVKREFMFTRRYHKDGFSFWFCSYDDVVDLWAIWKQLAEKFHGNAENYYSNVYGLLQENLLSKKFGGDIFPPNILLPEIFNHI